MADVSTLLDRFYDKFVERDGCWEWKRTNPEGRPSYFNANGRTVNPYRWIYETVVGPVPEGLELDHTCRNPKCVNPRHLEPVTGAENRRRHLEAILPSDPKDCDCPLGHRHGTLGMVRNHRCRCPECQGAKGTIRAVEKPDFARWGKL